MIVPPSVPDGAELLIIGQCPGVDEAKQGVPFVGRDGKQLREWLRRVGIDPSVVAYDNVHRDFNGDGVYKPTAKEIKAGWVLCQELIEALHPKVVLLVGGPAASAMFKGGITKVQGRQEIHDGIIYTAMLHPGYYRNALIHSRKQAVEAEGDILSVLHRVASILKGEADGTPQLPEGRYIRDDMAIMGFAPGGFEAIDVETCGDTKDPRRAEFVLAASAPRDIIMTTIPTIPRDARLLVHNVPYDGIVLGTWDCKWEDTKMLAHMMGEPDTTLKGLALRYLDHPMLSYEEAVRLNVLPEYCLDDAQTTWRLYPVLRECMDAGPLKLYDTLEAPLYPLWTKMSMEGSVYLDHEALAIYHEELSGRVNALLLDVEDMLPKGRVVKRCTRCDLRNQKMQTGQRCENGGHHRWETVYLADEPVNLNSPKQLLPALQSLGIPISSTRAEEIALILEDDPGDIEAEEELDEILDDLARAYPVLRALQAYRKAHKELSTYIEPWMQIPPGTRLGCIWNPTGTWTMRVSSRGPNMQNIPGHLYRFFHGGEGYTLLDFDHSQLELRLAAHVSGDPYMISVYRDGVDGGDMHSAVMKRLGLTDRRLAKVFNFGVLYDCHDTGAGFEINARKYGVKLDAREIMYAQRDMRQIIPGYIQWRSETMNLRKVPGLFGMQHYVPQGGKRSHQENEAVNAPIQGGGGITNKFGMKDLHYGGWEVTRQVHDSVTVRVRNQDVEDALVEVPRIMATAIPEPLRVPLEVEGKILGKSEARLRTD